MARTIAGGWIGAFVLLCVAISLAEAQSPRTAGSPRKTGGSPDIQGVWNFVTTAPLQRPVEFGTRRVLTKQEIAQQEQQAKDTAIDRPPREGDPGTYNRFWNDIPRVAPRTSMIVDPPDGRLPGLTPEAQRFQRTLAETRRNVDDDAPPPGGWVLDIGPHGLSVRCIVGFNAGPPMTGQGYNANVHIVQTPDVVMFVNEMIHSARIVPLDGRPHLSAAIRQWAGDSRGRWAGETLVVETTNFAEFVSDFTNDRPAGRTAKLIERFTRVDADTLLYQFTVDDPSWYVRPWTAELDMIKSSQPMYEYACHEGNQSVPNILRGARAREASSGKSPSTR